MTVPVGLDGALALYSAVGDACAGRRLGFGRRRAALAARFARHRGASDEAVAASWVAGALAEIGLICVVLLPAETGAQARLLADADAPLHGAHLVAAIPGVPPGAADIVRWHREHDDGTGVPDRLRWDGIPADAAALGIAHAFVEAVEHPDGPRDPAEALFAIVAESGRAFRIELVRSFRELVGAAAADWDAAPEIALPAIDEDALLAGLAAPAGPSTEAGDGTERLAEIAATVAAGRGLDANGAARLERLLAAMRAHVTGGGTPA